MESPSLDTKLDWGAKVFSEEPIKSGIQVVYSCHLIGTKQVLGMVLSFHLQVPNQACHSNVLFLLRILAPVRFRNLILYACMHLLPSLLVRFHLNYMKSPSWKMIELNEVRSYEELIQLWTR